MPAKEFKVKPTSAPARTVKGVIFRCWRVAILSYEWRSEDGRCVVCQPYGRDSYIVNVDGAGIRNKSDKRKRFRLWITAARAAVDKARGTPNVSQV